LTDTTQARLTQLIEETKNDAELQTLLGVVKHGWPERYKSTPTSIRPYWSVRDKITHLDGVLFIGQRFIVPATMRPYVLGILHESHQGIEKCKYRASECVYWPGLYRDIEEMVKTCSTCQAFQSSNRREPMIPHAIPDTPWTKLGSDILEFGGRNYLVVVDYTSKYPEIANLGTTKTASAVISKLKHIFSRHGIPEVLIADNMPYDSHEMRQFAAEWHFEITTSSPTYSQSNGKSENLVKTVKQILRKALEDKAMDVELALLNYRNTRVSGLSYSPAQMLMGRRLRGRLLIPPTALRPEVVDARSEIQHQQERQKAYYDRSARQRSGFSPGDKVLVKDHSRWVETRIDSRHETPRSYVLQDGRRRTSKHLRQRHGPREDLATSRSNQVGPDVPDPPEPSPDAETISQPERNLQSTSTPVVESNGCPSSNSAGDITEPDGRYPKRERKQRVDSDFHYY